MSKALEVQANKSGNTTDDKTTATASANGILPNKPQIEFIHFCGFLALDWKTTTIAIFKEASAQYFKARDQEYKNYGEWQTQRFLNPSATTENILLCNEWWRLVKLHERNLKLFTLGISQLAENLNGISGIDATQAVQWHTQGVHDRNQVKKQIDQWKKLQAQKAVGFQSAAQSDSRTATTASMPSIELKSNSDMKNADPSRSNDNLTAMLRDRRLHWHEEPRSVQFLKTLTNSKKLQFLIEGCDRIRGDDLFEIMPLLSKSLAPSEFKQYLCESKDAKRNAPLDKLKVKILAVIQIENEIKLHLQLVWVLEDNHVRDWVNLSGDQWVQWIKNSGYHPAVCRPASQGQELYRKTRMIDSKSGANLREHAERSSYLRAHFCLHNAISNCSAGILNKETTKLDNFFMRWKRQVVGGYQSYLLNRPLANTAICLILAREEEYWKYIVPPPASNGGLLGFGKRTQEQVESEQEMLAKINPVFAMKLYGQSLKKVLRKKYWYGGYLWNLQDLMYIFCHLASEQDDMGQEELQDEILHAVRNELSDRFAGVNGEELYRAALSLIKKSLNFEFLEDQLLNDVNDCSKLPRLSYIHWPKFVNVAYRRAMVAKKLAFSSALHPRLGQDSSLLKVARECKNIFDTNALKVCFEFADLRQDPQLQMYENWAKTLGYLLGLWLINIASPKSKLARSKAIEIFPSVAANFIKDLKKQFPKENRYLQFSFRCTNFYKSHAKISVLPFPAEVQKRLENSEIFLFGSKLERGDKLKNQFFRYTEEELDTIIETMRQLNPDELNAWYRQGMEDQESITLWHSQMKALAVASNVDLKAVATSNRDAPKESLTMPLSTAAGVTKSSIHLALSVASGDAKATPTALSGAMAAGGPALFTLPNTTASDSGSALDANTSSAVLNLTG
jgi:hypothetical protein